MAHPAAFLGIDFGTAYSAMAWVDPTTGHADVLCNAEGDEKTRSAVYFGKDEVYVGRLAEELLEHEEESEFVLLGAKRDLMRNVPYSLPDGRMVTPMDVAVSILAKLKRDAELSHFHETVSKAVITVPAIFDPLERKKVVAAAIQAGFETVELLDEPVAAAIAYLQSGQKVGRRVLVYDLGAGTFDVAILDHEESELQPFRLAMPPEGLQFGGDDLDALLWSHLIALANGDASTIRQDRSLALRLLHRCRRLKEVLSSRESHKLDYQLPNGKRLQQTITRGDCERVFQRRLEETVGIASHLFDKAVESGGKPDTLVLIGGSSRIPMISRLLSNAIPLSPRSWHRQDVAVALGAALYADVIWGHKRHRTYRDALKHAKRTGQISATKLNQLRTQLHLNDAEAGSIENDELGSSVESLVAQSHLSATNKYQEVVASLRMPITEAIVRQLEQEANKLQLSPSDVAEIERQIFGDSKEKLLAREASKRHAVAEEFIVKAGALQNDGNLDGALEQAQLACDRAPNSADSHFLKGHILLELGKLELAESALEVALELNPHYCDALFRRGLCRLFLGKAADACEDFDAVVLSHSPTSVDVYYFRAIARARIGDPQGAASDLTKSLADEKSFESVCNTPAVGAILSLAMLKLRLLQCPMDAIACFGQVLKVLASDNGSAPAAVLSSLCWFFGEDPEIGDFRPSDVLIALAHATIRADRNGHYDILPGPSL